MGSVPRSDHHSAVWASGVPHPSSSATTAATKAPPLSTPPITGVQKTGRWVISPFNPTDTDFIQSASLRMPRRKVHLGSHVHTSISINECVRRLETYHGFSGSRVTETGILGWQWADASPRSIQFFSRLDLQSNTYVMLLELPTHTCAIYSHSFPGPSPGDRLSYMCPHSPSAPLPTVSPAPCQLRRVLGTLKTEFGSLCVSNDPPQCCETAQRDSIHWPNLTLSIIPHCGWYPAGTPSYRRVCCGLQPEPIRLA